MFPHYAYPKTIVINDQPIIVETLMHASVNSVWEAITSKEQMKAWYFDFDYFDAKEGFDFRFSGSNEHRSYWHLCAIVEVVPKPKAFAYMGLLRIHRLEYSNMAVSRARS